MPDGDDDRDAGAAADTDTEATGAADAAGEHEDPAHDGAARDDAGAAEPDARTPGWWRRRPAVLMLVLGLIAVTAAAVILMQPADGEQPQSGDYADADDPSGRVTDAPADATVTIDGDGVAPARVTVDVGGTVRWRNQRTDTVTLSFDRIDGTKAIAAGETLTMEFSGITYYTVDDAAGDRVGRGRVNVQ